ncbi:hypothetical protein MPER_03949, partial [Moniliophthora perniciosa FA553]
ADALQSLCYTLCHVFARATKSISIPAPVALCGRARNHYSQDLQSEVGSTRDGGSTELEAMRADFRPIHRNQERRTFFTYGSLFDRVKLTIFPSDHYICESCELVS